MERRSTYGYIYLGTAVRYLLDADEGMLIYANGGINENINGLRERLQAYEFLVTWRLSNSLLELQTPWAAERAESEDPASWDTSRGLTKSEGATLNRLASMIRETMLAEAEGKLAYIAVDKRNSVEILTGDIGRLLGVGVYAKLPEIAQHDLAEAGRAIAFDLPTAGAFHLLRGTESVLRDFYLRVVKRNRIAEPQLWAAMVTHMRSKSNAPAALLLDNLDSLRRHFRNPTQHPDKTYDSDEVQDLLALSIDSINRMVRHLADKSL